VVIGSRALQASVVEHRRSTARRMGAAVFRALARGVVPGVSDTQCGFKFFSGPLARAAARPLRTAGFAFDIELIANCLRLGATLTEIPVRWRDVPGSSFSVWRHSVGSFGDIASIWLRSRGRLAGPPSAGFGRYVPRTAHDHDRGPERHEADQVSRTRYSYVSGSATVSVRE
jgi:hypothetical protein